MRKLKYFKGTTINGSDMQLYYYDDSIDFDAIEHGFDLKDIEIPSDVKTVNIENNYIDELFVPKNVEWLSCFYNELTSLTFEKGSRLKYLECDSNHLTRLDLPDSLDRIECDKGVELSRIDIGEIILR